MVKRYYIALYLLGINNSELINIMEQLPENELKYIFQNKFIELQYKYNISLEKHYTVLADKIETKRLLKKADKIILDSKKNGVKIILYKNKYYPSSIKELKDAPGILYLKGKYIVKKDEKSVACIGSRNITNFGAGAVEKIVSSLVNEKFTIVSGLALGIDKYAHEICLQGNGKAIAVLAHGLDMIYPKENKALANKILEKGGTLLSEYPVGEKPEKYKFVKRNRLVAALSKGTIIFEAQSKSGSMHTVNFAQELNKKIFCPVPNQVSQNVSGLVDLLNTKSAIPIACKNDYRKIVIGLNYKLNKNLIQTKKLKNNIIKELANINNLEYTEIKKEKEKLVKLKVDNDVYMKLKEKLQEEGLNISEYLNSLFNYSLK